jgi:uncharacterized protein YeaO (DUF488 family)
MIPSLCKVVWVDGVKPKHEGCKMTLKDCKGFWDIVKVYEKELEKKDLKHGWNVGGL